MYASQHSPAMVTLLLSFDLDERENKEGKPEDVRYEELESHDHAELS